jgi:hypothetical protein
VINTLDHYVTINYGDKDLNDAGNGTLSMTLYSNGKVKLWQIISENGRSDWQ